MSTDLHATHMSLAIANELLPRSPASPIGRADVISTAFAWFAGATLRDGREPAGLESFCQDAAEAQHLDDRPDDFGAGMALAVRFLFEAERETIEAGVRVLQRNPGLHPADVLSAIWTHPLTPR